MSVQAAQSSVAQLEADAVLLQGANREAMLRTALALYDDSCPVCGTEFDFDTFERVVKTKLDALSAASEKRRALESQLDPIADVLGRREGARRTRRGCEYDLRRDADERTRRNLRESSRAVQWALPNDQSR